MAPRLTTAATALLAAAAIGVISTAAATAPSGVAAATGRSGWMIPALLSAAGLVCLTVALTFTSPHPIALALALLGAAWLVGIPSSGVLRPSTAVAGGGLLAVGELAYWSLDFKIAGRDEATVYRRRAATIAVLVGASTALAVVPEANLGAVPVSGLGLTAAGLLAVATLVAVAAALAWRLRPPAATPGGTRPARLD